MTTHQLIEQIDQTLPQTQCGLCGYGGCLPYAKAIAQQNEVIDRCPPGGETTLRTLAKLTHQDPEPLLPDFLSKVKTPVTVSINEAECIGCTKCIQACPVDAIIGSSKQMHTVIKSECTGCELCIEPCPVDCIEVHPISEKFYSPDKARIRFDQRNARLANEKKAKQKRHTLAKHTDATDRKKTVEARKNEIAQAIARVQLKRKALNQ